jgi:hypothetical protein
MSNLTLIHSLDTGPLMANVIFGDHEYMKDEALRLRNLAKRIILHIPTVPTSRAHADYNLSLYDEVLKHEEE